MRNFLKGRHELRQDDSSTASSTLSSSPTTKNKIPPPMTMREQGEVMILVTTMGELGNHLQLLPAGYGVKDYLKKRHGIESDVTFYHAKSFLNDKGSQTHAKLIKCFRGLQGLEYLLPVDADTNHTHSLGSTSTIVTIPNAMTDKKKSLDTRYALPTKQSYPDENVLIRIVPSVNESIAHQRIDMALKAARQGTPEKGKWLMVLFIPLGANAMQPSRDIVQAFFPFDHNACPCQLDTVIQETDTVFHIRGFLTEFEKLKMREDKRFEELDPERVAENLLGHLSPAKHDTVAIMSRYAEAANPFLSILEKSGIPSRVLQSGSDMEDFCLLSQASRVAGHTQSTFFTWAALHLNNNLRRADAYQIKGKYQFISRDQNQTCRGFGDNITIFCHVFEARFDNSRTKSNNRRSITNTIQSNYPYGGKQRSSS